MAPHIPCGGRHERHRRPLLATPQEANPEIALDERFEQDEARSGFCWIALHEPSADELHTLQAAYHLHPLAVDNAMHPLCPPKPEVYNDELYIVAQTAELVGDKISWAARRRSSPVTTTSSRHGTATVER